MGIGIWHLDKRTNTVTWTRQLEEIYGLEASKVKTYEEFRNLVHPDDVQEMEKGRDAAVRARKPIQFEFRIIRPNGEVRWIMGIGCVKYDEVTGEPVRTVGTNIDITARKNAEQRVEFQRNEITYVMRVAMLGGLSAGIAHELGQPLTGILANAQAARTLLSSKSPAVDEIASILEDIIQDGIRARDVIRHLRTLLKNEKRQLKQISLNELITSTVTLLHSELVIRKVVLERQLESNLPSIIGDPVQLQQVFLNLIMNALDAIASGPSSRRAVSIVTRQGDNGNVEVSICDRGPGMSSDELRRSTEPFFTTKKEGLGLGLSISSMIVASHGGLLNLSNAPGGGLIATVSLPRRAPSDQQ